MRALRRGAAGYLTKDHSPEQLVEAIRKVARGGKYVSATLAERLAGDVGRRPALAPARAPERPRVRGAPRAGQRHERSRKSPRSWA